MSKVPPRSRTTRRVGVASLVMSSVLLTPVSEEASRSTAIGAAGGVKSAAVCSAASWSRSASEMLELMFSDVPTPPAVA